MASALFVSILGWLLAWHAVGVGAHLPGLLLVLRRAPRSAAVPLAAAALALEALAAALAPAGQVAACLTVGLAASLPLGLLISAIRPMRPDAAFVPPLENPQRWDARPVNLPADPGAGAIALEPHAKRADRACIVVGHGGGNDRVYGLWPLLPALLDRGFAVVLAHLPGHGRGGEDLYSTDRGRARMDALVELALGPLGAGCVLLLGQSMGAAFALDATLRGSRARAVVAISAPIELAPLSAALRDVLAFAHPAVYRALRYGTPLELMPAVGPFRREQFPVRLEPGVHYLDAFAATVRELDLERRLQSVSPPALPPLFFVHGAADAIAPSPPAVRTAAALGPAARTLVVPAVRHLDILFRPEVVGAVADWLVEQADRRV